MNYSPYITTNLFYHLHRSSTVNTHQHEFALNPFASIAKCVSRSLTKKGHGRNEMKKKEKKKFLKVHQSFRNENFNVSNRTGSFFSHCIEVETFSRHLQRRIINHFDDNNILSRFGNYRATDYREATEPKMLVRQNFFSNSFYIPIEPIVSKRKKKKREKKIVGNVLRQKFESVSSKIFLGRLVQNSIVASRDSDREQCFTSNSKFKV